MVDASDALQAHPVLEPDDFILAVVEGSFEVSLYEIADQASTFWRHVSLNVVYGYRRFGPDY